MSGHTPGPWVYMGMVTVEDVEAWTVKCADKRYIRAEGRSYDEAEANARLIAAAPDLLIALKRLYVAMFEINPNDYTPNLQEAADAIAKAEGRT